MPTSTPPALPPGAPAFVSREAVSLRSESPFGALGLSPPSLRALDALGYRVPTPVQAQAIPLALAGRDVLGCAPTGTGKTAAFLLPMLERLGASSVEASPGPPPTPEGLVLAPTRELALQTATVARRLGAAHGVRVATLMGGADAGAQTAALRRARLVVATPGRLVDHLRQGNLTLQAVAVLVLDEADRMLDLGFRPQLRRILARLPRRRQTLLFSATLPPELTGFAKLALRRPARVEVAPSGTVAPGVEQALYALPKAEKTALLHTLLGELDGRTLVFVRTKRRAEKLTRALEREGHRVERIHADRSQAQRRFALDAFARGGARVLVATDVAARGLDVAGLAHVVNFELPHAAEDYVHRIGRTARADAVGRASTFCAPDEVALLAAIEALVGAPLPRRDVPRDAPRFVAALAAERARQADPGPPPAAAPAPRRTPGRPPGRHARTHRKPPR